MTPQTYISLASGNPNSGKKEDAKTSKHGKEDTAKQTDVEKTVKEDVETEPEPPKPKTYTTEEIAEISARVEQYADNTPPYDPKHILSPEYKGTSNYEEGIRQVRQETQDKLDALMADPHGNKQQIRLATEDLKTLDHLYENYHIGMNVFRTAHGGRSKLRKER